MSKTVSEVVLISEDLLKKYSPITENVSVKKVMPYVILAQQFHIEPILGSVLTNDLQIAVGNGNLNELEKALILKIAPALANWTAYHALRTMAYTITEKGVTREHSENSESVNRDELGDLLYQLKETAEKCEELLIRYLCVCRPNYPSWMPFDGDCKCEKYEMHGGKAHGEKSFKIFFPNRHKPNKCGCEGTKEPVTAPFWVEVSEACETEQ